MTQSDGFQRRVRAHLVALYPDADLDELAEQAVEAIGIVDGDDSEPPGRPSRWDERDAILITYGDSIIGSAGSPLEALRQVVGDLRPAISTVHILPFFPYSSDRGFSVVDHLRVDPDLGSWRDIDAIGQTADLMMDLVCNHASVESAWFRNFLADRAPGHDYFVTAPADADTSSVVRPRAQPLLHPFSTTRGERHVWCTFGGDQADLDHTNPAVLLEILRIIDLYVTHGARFIRLDAVAYLWKSLGGPCIHLPETHEVIRLWHTLLGRRAPAVALVTETNVPNDENLSYFGAGDEAHVVYNFSLPPLVLDAVLHGRSEHLRTWMEAMQPAPPGCTYLNFLASHDGIGVRPAEGILSDAEIAELVAITESRGGRHGTYDSPTGPRPYELNIALWDLLRAPAGGIDDGFQTDRFVCAHAIMLGLEGIPAIYINSLFARPNDVETMELTGVRRDISRARIAIETVRELLTDPRPGPGQASAELVRLLGIRRAQPAFHPDAEQRTLDLGTEIFAFERRSPDDSQVVVAVHNCAATTQSIEVGRLGLDRERRWSDLVTGSVVGEPDGELPLAPYQSAWFTNLAVGA